MVQVCLDAGVAEERLLCLEHPPPMDTSELVTVATDDVITIHDDPDAARSCGLRLDAAMLRRGIQPNSDKSEDMQDSIEALGCVLGNDPPWVEPALPSLYRVLCASLFLSQAGPLAPKTFSSILGTLQWFAQPTRWLFSVFDQAYNFRTLEPPTLARALPAAASDEVLLFVALSPLASVDMERPVLPIIAACDAAPQFGFGVAVRACDPDTATRLSCQATQLDRYLHFTGVDQFRHLDAYGEPLSLPYSLDTFTPVLSLKAHRREHSGAMEAHGVVLLAQWAARCADRHSARLVTAIDARAVLGAAKKGRSSAATLKRPIARLAATCLAADLQLSCLWVPSAHNPADAPSRGKRNRPGRRDPTKVMKAVIKSSPVQAATRLYAAERRLFATGMLP